MELLEAFSTYYTVKRKSNDTFDVAKFSGGKQPERVDKVRQEAAHSFDSTAPGFYRAKQQDKSILIVKQFIKDKEPDLAHYTVGQDRKVLSHKFESNITEGWAPGWSDRTRKPTPEEENKVIDAAKKLGQKLIGKYPIAVNKASGEITYNATDKNGRPILGYL